MKDMYQRTITAFLVASIFTGLWYLFGSWALPIIITLCGGIILVIEWPRFNRWLLTPLYPVLPLICLLSLHDSSGQMLLLYHVLILGAHDSGAYAFGSIWGKHIIAPLLSPKKSWEGFVGGTITSLIAAYLISMWLKSPYTLFVIIYIMIINVLNLMGDLFESSLKRTAGIKDSANLLPGHGGFLDRFDGLLFIAPLLIIFKKQLISLLFCQHTAY